MRNGAIAVLFVILVAGSVGVAYLAGRRTITITSTVLCCTYTAVPRCNFSLSVVAAASEIRSEPGFIQLEDGANYTLVSAYQNSEGGVAYVGGTTTANGAVSYATTIYYPPNWFFWFMPLPAYCSGGGSWVGVSFIRATVNSNPDGGFNLSGVRFYQDTFYPNATG